MIGVGLSMFAITCGCLAAGLIGFAVAIAVCLATMRCRGWTWEVYGRPRKGSPSMEYLQNTGTAVQRH